MRSLFCFHVRRIEAETGIVWSGGVVGGRVVEWGEGGVVEWGVGVVEGGVGGGGVGVGGGGGGGGWGGAFSLLCYLKHSPASMKNVS